MEGDGQQVSGAVFVRVSGLILQTVGPGKVCEQRIDVGRFGFGEITVANVQGRLEWEELKAGKTLQR